MFSIFVIFSGGKGSKVWFWMGIRCDIRIEDLVLGWISKLR